MNIRLATQKDTSVLAKMNLQLIQDEGHRNSMSYDDLFARMSGWLNGNYKAALIEIEGQIVGYSLWLTQEDYVYIRQFFIRNQFRRKGIGSLAFKALTNHYWKGQRLRLDVLVNNERGLEFWRSLGFGDYCLTLERI